MLVNHAKPDINSTQPLILAFVQDQHVIATNPTTQSLISVMIVDKEDGVKMPSVESKPTNAELLH
jgi:flavorubredoxin